MRVADYLKDVDLATYSLYVRYFCDFVFFKYLDCDLLLREKMDSLFHFAEGALSQSLCHSVAAYDWLFLLLRFKVLRR